MQIDKGKSLFVLGLRLFLGIPFVQRVFLWKGWVISFFICLAFCLCILSNKVHFSDAGLMRKNLPELC